jgi:hypothetical protein
MRSFLALLLTFSGEPRFADVDAIDTASNPSDFSTRADFRQNLIARDGTCVFSGEHEDECDACHILPHSKGDIVRFLGYNS